MTSEDGAGVTIFPPLHLGVPAAVHTRLVSRLIATETSEPRPFFLLAQGNNLEIAVTRRHVRGDARAACHCSLVG